MAGLGLVLLLFEFFNEVIRYRHPIICEQLLTTDKVNSLYASESSWRFALFLIQSYCFFSLSIRRLVSLSV